MVGFYKNHIKYKQSSIEMRLKILLKPNIKVSKCILSHSLTILLMLKKEKIRMPPVFPSILVTSFHKEFVIQKPRVFFMISMRSKIS